MVKMRLNKYLSECGVASRRNSEQFILDGRISVNGQVVIDLATQIDPAKDEVSFDGSKISQAKKVYFLINKPNGVITTTKDEKNRPNQGPSKAGTLVDYARLCPRWVLGKIPPEV